VVDERQRQHAARTVIGAPVQIGIEARIRVAVRHIDDLAIPRAAADQARVSGHAHRLDPGRNAKHQLICGCVVQPHRGAIGAQDLRRRAYNGGEHGREFERSR
jgi:hypothetical protein